MLLFWARPKLLRDSEPAASLVGGHSPEDDEDEMINAIHLKRTMSLTYLIKTSRSEDKEIKDGSGFRINPAATSLVSLNR